MEIETNTYLEKTVVTLVADRLDAAVAVPFKEKLKTLVDDGVNHMILNLENIEFMDSSGLGAVVAHMKYMGVERVFEIAGLTPTVDKVFKLTRMDKVFRIHTSISEAIGEDFQKTG